ALDPLEPNDEYGARPFAPQHLFNAAYSIELPQIVHNNYALGGVVDGWQFSGITSVQSGVNLTANSANQNFNTTSSISSSLKTQPNSLNAFVSTITPYSINGTDQIALNPILTCDPRKNLGPHQFLNGNCFS